MCEPTTALVAASLALSGVQAYSQYQNGKYESEVASQNADIATSQANDAINRGNIEASQRRRQTSQALGSQAALMGATGTDISTGGALDIFGDTAQFGALDALTTVNNAQREAYGFQTQAVNYESQASAARSQGNFGAMTTLLTAPIDAYGAYKISGGSWSPFTQSKAAPVTAAIGTKTGR